MKRLPDVGCIDWRELLVVGSRLAALNLDFTLRRHLTPGTRTDISSSLVTAPEAKPNVVLIVSVHTKELQISNRNWKQMV